MRRRLRRHSKCTVCGLDGGANLVAVPLREACSGAAAGCVGGCESETKNEISVTTDRHRRRSGVQGTAVEKAPLPCLEGGAGEIFGWMMGP
jgi:hypothetical protein